MRELAPDFFDEVPLGVEGLELVQHAVGSIEGSKLDLIVITHALVKVGEPLLSLQLYEVIKRGAVLEIGHRGADSCPSLIEVSLGPTQFTPRLSQLSLEDLNPGLSHASQAPFLIKRGLVRRLLKKGALLAFLTLLLQRFPRLRLLGLRLSLSQLELNLGFCVGPPLLPQFLPKLGGLLHVWTPLFLGLPQAVVGHLHHFNGEVRLGRDLLEPGSELFLFCP